MTVKSEQCCELTFPPQCHLAGVSLSPQPEQNLALKLHTGVSPTNNRLRRVGDTHRCSCVAPVEALFVFLRKYSEFSRASLPPQRHSLPSLSLKLLNFQLHTKLKLLVTSRKANDQRLSRRISRYVGSEWKSQRSPNPNH